MKKKNKLDSILEPLFEKKEKLISSIEVSCNSIQFWEERAEKIFDEIDKTEEESFFTSEKDEAHMRKKTRQLRGNCMATA